MAHADMLRSFAGPDANFFAKAVWHYVNSLAMAAKSKSYMDSGDSARALLFQKQAADELHKLKVGSMLLNSCQQQSIHSLISNQIIAFILCQDL